jgi:hypothetical protein
VTAETKALLQIINKLHEPQVSVGIGTFRVLVLGALKSETISGGKAAELLGCDLLEVRRLADEFAEGDGRS